MSVHKKRVFFGVLVLLLLFSVSSIPQYALAAQRTSSGVSVMTSQTTQVGTVSADTLYVRRSASNTAKTIGALQKGSNVYIISSSNGWYNITYNSTTGWVYGAYVSNVKPINVTPSPTPSPSPSPSPTPTPSPTPSPSPTPTPTPSPTPTPAPSSNLPSKILIGYYSSWSAYSGYTPDKIPASKLNVIHYAFAGVGTDLKIAAGDPTVDYDNFARLNALKKSYPNLKTFISIGGWDGSERFSDMALNDSTRKAFAQSCVTFIKQYGFDGIDIDWEYPVSGGCPGRPEDKTNFTLLMQTLREALNTQGQADGKYYYLTFAGGASNSYINNVQLPQLANYVDYAVDMTYDLHGPWDTYADLNTPLYTPTESSPQYKVSVDSSLKAWINAGFPKDKLVMGIAFYGYDYSGVTSANNGLYSSFTSASSIGYDKIVSTYLSSPSYTRYFHSTAQVPYLYGNGHLISYDDPDSIARKLQYSAANGLRGASAWELSYDKSAALLGAAYNNLFG